MSAASVTAPALVAGLAVWVLFPHPGARLGQMNRHVFQREPRSGRRKDALLSALAAGLLFAAVGRWPGIVLGALAGGAGFLLLGRLPQKDPMLRAVAAELPDALDFLAVCVAAGLPLQRSVETVSRVSPAATASLLETVARQMALGRVGPDAWSSLASHPAWGRAATDIARAERSGTTLVSVLHDHAADARQEAADLATKRARTVGVQSAIPLMVCFLPAFIMIGVIPIIASLLGDFFG